MALLDTFLAPPADRLRDAVVRRVRATFNDTSRGQTPVPPSDDALFPPDSPIRMVHADVTAMMVGGIRGLLLQMLHQSHQQIRQHLPYPSLL